MKLLICIFLILVSCLVPGTVQADLMDLVPLWGENRGDTEQVSLALQLLIVVTVISVAPAIVLMTTAFIRVVIVLSFIRQAMGVHNMPPNQVVIGLALFLTIFIMSPMLKEINNYSLQPYINEEIGEEEALERAVQPLREFMFSQVREKDLMLMMEISNHDRPEGLEEVSTWTLIPAFMLSELKRAFTIGFLIYIPFLIIDMITASVLMTMGMLMLPPVIISLPFKVLLFVLVDGWHMIVGSLVQSFH